MIKKKFEYLVRIRVNVADIRLWGLSIVNKVNERTVIRKLNG